MDPSIQNWIWLAEACGPNNGNWVRLLHMLHTVDAVYCADRKQLTALGFLKDAEIHALCNKSLSHAQRILASCAEKKIGILTYAMDLYPERLRRIQNPPAVIYYRGTLPDFSSHLALAVVGTRSMTEDGRKNAYRFAYELALCGTIIVSGMAIGIDGTAQQAALDASGKTVAVLGSAIDVCYPQEHQELYQTLLLHGGIISEYAPGTQTQRWYFPQRNRIISGLCQGTLVAEAGYKSGALITARTALAQGRDVFAVPGDPRTSARVGTNNLIKDGAYPVTESSDILRHYADLYTTLSPEKLKHREYFRSYDDRMKYKSSTQPAVIATEHPLCAPIPIPPVRHTAPEQLPLREEPREKTDRFFTKAHAPQTAAVSAAATEKHQTTEQTAASADKPTLSAKNTYQPGLLPGETLSEEQLRICDLLKQRMTFDEICASGFSAGTLMTNLTILEIAGKIEAMPGGYFVAINES